MLGDGDQMCNKGVHLKTQKIKGKSWNHGAPHTIPVPSSFLLLHFTLVTHNGKDQTQGGAGIKVSTTGTGFQL